ncbi:MAG: hypothetical protein WDN49_05755 [Acetobacteraceae bacterium]
MGNNRCVLIVEGTGVRTDMANDHDSMEVLQDMTCVLDGDLRFTPVHLEKCRAVLRFREA